METSEKIIILHQRISQSFYEEKNYLLCDKLVKALLELDADDEIALNFQSKLSGMNLIYIKKDWENSQDLHGYNDEKAINRITDFLRSLSDMYEITKILK